MDLYNLACAYANLSALTEPGSAPPTAAERKALSDRAMGTLRRSLAADMADFATIDRDHALDPLRERLDFRILIAESAGRARELAPPSVAARLDADRSKVSTILAELAAFDTFFRSQFRLRLLSDRAVRDDLKLTPEQTEAIRALGNGVRDAEQVQL